MATNSLNLTNRLTGLYSGLDTDSLVSTMMQIEQLKLNRQLRSLTTMQWKQEAYNNINSDLKTFMNDYISVLGSNSMMKSNNYVTYDAAVTGDKASSVTVTGSSSAYEGTISINSITQLAKASAAKSSAKVSGGSELSDTNSAPLSSLDFANKLEFVNDRIAFSINGVEFSFKSTDSLQTVINTINSSDAGVNMIYSRLTDTISIESKTEGEDGSVRINNISGNAFGANSAFRIDNGAYENGQNALLNINGVDVERSSNTFDIDGVNYKLHTTFDETDGPVIVSLTQNVDKAVDSVKQFITGYNTLINKLTELTTTRRSREERGYVALTDAEKAEMTEEQIEQWEKIAKSDLLYNDAGISRLLTNLRGAFYDTIEGLGISPSEIGLRTKEYATNGEIELNEDVLRAALQKNPHQVMNVFMSISQSDDTKTAYNENGLLYRINTLMNSYMKGSGQTSLDTLETSIFSTSKRIGDMESKMEDLQERYYLKYAALEKAMASLESQSNWLVTMLGSSKQ